jgi:hypothetical protein
MLVMMTKDCKPVESFLAPGFLADVDDVRIFNFEPESSMIMGWKTS